MEDLSDEDFDSLQIKPRGQKASPKPSPMKQNQKDTSPNVLAASFARMDNGMILFFCCKI